ncbi:MAG: ParA family protein [Pirellulaceae bacterium]
MSRVICVANQKGGVGKTTTAINLSVALAKADCRTMLIDLDPQCNATTGLGIEPTDSHPMISAEPLQSQIAKTKKTELSLLPGSRRFEDIERLARCDEQSARCLQGHLENDMDEFDFVIIDCPPSLGRLTETALASSTEVLMPIQCEYFAMEGLTQMIEVIRRVMKGPKNRLEFGGIVLTMFDHRLELTREVDTEVRDFFGDIVFQTVVPRDVAVSEAPSHGQAVLDYAPRSRGARAYIELCMEVLDRV